MSNCLDCFPELAIPLTFSSGMCRWTVSPYPCQHLEFSLFMILAILNVCSDVLFWFLRQMSWWILMLNTFSCSSLSFIYFLSEMSVQIFCSFFKWIFLFLISDISLYILITSLCLPLSCNLLFVFSSSWKSKLIFFFSWGQFINIFKFYELSFWYPVSVLLISSIIFKISNIYF